MSRPNWRKIADGLAERLMHHTSCAQHDDPTDDDAEDCPFCADIRAYTAYVEAGGTKRITSFNERVTVNVMDLLDDDSPTRRRFGGDA